MRLACVLLAVAACAAASERASAAELVIGLDSAGPNYFRGAPFSTTTTLRHFPGEHVTGFVTFRPTPGFERFTPARLASSVVIVVHQGDEEIAGFDWTVGPLRVGDDVAGARIELSAGSFAPGEYAVSAAVKEPPFDAASGLGGRWIWSKPVRVIAGPPIGHEEMMWAGLRRASEALHAAGDCALAERRANELLDREPRSLLALDVLARARAGAGNVAGALTAWETAREVVEGGEPSAVALFTTREELDQELHHIDSEIEGLIRPIPALRAFDADGRFIASTTIDGWMSFDPRWLGWVSCVDSEGYVPQLVGSGVQSVVLERAHRMRVSVRSSAGGPLRDATARLITEYSECPRQVSANADGVVVIDVPPGGGLVEFRAADHWTAQVMVGAESRDDATVELLAGPGVRPGGSSPSR